jgi:hypothetical protein
MLIGSQDSAYPYPVSNEFVRELMDSKVRFGWEEMSGVHHVSYYLNVNEGDEIFNESGWASRFILCAMIVEGTKIGATMDLDAMFADMVGPDDQNENQEVDDQTLEPIREINTMEFKRSDSFNLQCEIDDKYNELERLNSRVLNSKNVVPETTRLDDIETKLNLLLDQGVRARVRHRTKIDDDDDKTILPNDSSSCISRYNKKFLPNGTIYNVESDGKTVLAIQPKVHKPVIVKNVVAGYMKTIEMEKVEQDIIRKVVPINGLSNPFKSNRLNLLCHFHTAIESVKMNGNVGHYEAIESLYKFKAITPSQELGFQMITKTFDLKNKRVVANPFKLPFLEVGMQISDDSLAKSFDLLRLEYKMLWFDEMKSLKIPDFHSDYDRFKEHKLGATKKTSKSSNQSSTAKVNTKKPPSILSFK